LLLQLKFKKYQIQLSSHARNISVFITPNAEKSEIKFHPNIPTTGYHKEKIKTTKNSF